MVSKKQWLLILVVTAYTALSVGGGIAGSVGGAVAGFVVMYGLTTGYNGEDLTERVRNWVSRN